MGHLYDGGNSSYKAVLLDCHLHSMNSAFKTPQGIYLLFYCERKKTTPNWTESSHLLQDRNKRSGGKKKFFSSCAFQEWRGFGAAAAAFELTSTPQKNPQINLYPCLNVLVMQIDGATDGKEREKERWRTSDCLSVL